MQKNNIFRFVCAALIALLPLLLTAQCYDPLLKRGNTAMANKNYDAAIKAWTAAKSCSDLPQNHKLNAQIAKAEKAKNAPAPEPPKPTPEPAKPKPSTPANTTDPFAGTMIRVQGGSFNMGSNENSDEKPIHSVSVSSFSICKYEVTQAQYRAIMGSNPSYFKGCDDCPVETVSWDDAQAFIRKLNQQTGKFYRLPTEAEWEYAARGGNQSRGYTYSGSNDVGSVAQYDGNNNKKPKSVGSKNANELGIYDMSGNVYEWCADWYKGYPGSTGVSDFTGSARVIRGGGWFGGAENCRSAYRGASTVDNRGGSLGFRLAY